MPTLRFRGGVCAATLLIFLLALALPASLFAQSDPAASTPVAAAVLPHKAVMKTTYFGSLKARFEDYNWFPAKTDNGAYTFGGIILRLGVTRSTPTEDLTLELEQPTLIGVPSRASGPSPVGASGAGANYFAANYHQNASLFPVQVFARFKQIARNPAASFRAGRFEYSDGVEVPSKDSTLAYLKRTRIQDRLIGPSAYTLVGRTLNGFQFVSDTPKLNLTALGAIPSRGSYSLNGWDILDQIKIGYVAATYPQPGIHANGEGRIFGVYYEDQRGKVVKVDNRSAGMRSGDHSGIHIGTLGGNYERTWDLGSGRIDGLFWGAGQVGNWGKESHGAFAFDAELGYQLPSVMLKPWFRAGYGYFSGDGNGANNTHGTYIPLLPTSRNYARFPFYTQANLKDLFGQVILRPNPKLTIRSDVHGLRLADAHDLWYTGGGAYENLNFGYTGRPSGGHSNLGTLVDVSVDYQFLVSTSLTLYAAYAAGGDVISTTYRGKEATMGYIELLTRF